jgi:nitrite reductase/ring-hydroxylating ferredoxin subunit
LSPGLLLVGLSVLGTWGLASIALIAGGIIMLFFPGSQETASDNTVGGLVLLVAGLVSVGLMQMTVAPLLGLDPPLPLKAKNRIPQTKLKRWANAGPLDSFPDGTPKEIRIRSQRVAIVRMGENVYALGALCSHARLPLGGFPGSPIKAEPIRDDCVMCPFHGARFEVTTGKVVRQPFSSEFNEQHPFLGRLQNKLMFFNRKAEDMQTYPARVEDGDVMVHLPK